jgi:hypothetical protein
MFAIDIEFTDGSTFEGLMWSWSPESGWVEVLDETNGERTKLWLSEIKTGLLYSDRIRKNAKTEDLIEKARQEGFK